MIIGQDVLRLLTLKALRGRTWAGGRVYDSPAQPADLKIEEERAPFIGIYTDDADIDLDGQSFVNPTSKVYLLIECAAADQVTVVPNEPGRDIAQAPAGQQVTVLAQTDESLELVIGLIARQVIQALDATDSPWAELWRLLTVPGRDRVEVRRGGPGQQEKMSAIRFASRIMRMQLNVLADPVYGEAIPVGFWQRFFEMAEADPEIGGIAHILRAHIETTPGLPSWRIEQKRGTYTLEGLAALGIAPLPQVVPDEAEPPQLREILDDRGGPIAGLEELREFQHGQ